MISVSKYGMGVRFRKTGVVALALILAGIAVPAVYARWLNTRSFVCVELPVSLAPGRISSTDFSVNLEGWYQIGVDVDQGFPFRFDCGFGGRPPLLRTRTAIYENGLILEHSDGEDRFLGHFYAKPTKQYRLNIEVLTDASCLNSGHPRVFAWTNPGSYYYLQDILWVASAVLILAGLGTLLFSVMGHSPGRYDSESELSISAGKGVYSPAHHARPLRTRFAKIPSFGLFHAMTLGAVILPTFLIYFYAWGYDRPVVGIRVRLVEPGPLRSASSFSPPELVLHVECTRLDTSPRFYLNSATVQPRELPDTLKLELKSRAEWIVYVAGDTDCNWREVADSMDIVRNAGARVVLLTADNPYPDSTRSHR